MPEDPNALTAEAIRIMALGSAQQRPSGTRILPGVLDQDYRDAVIKRLGGIPGMPKTSAAWEKIKQLYPFVAASGQGIFLDPQLMKREQAGAKVYPDRSLAVSKELEHLSPQEIESTLIHELVHVAQYLNTPGWPRADKPYRDRPEEDQAFMAEGEPSNDIRYRPTVTTKVKW